MSKFRLSVTNILQWQEAGIETQLSFHVHPGFCGDCDGNLGGYSLCHSLRTHQWRHRRNDLDLCRQLLLFRNHRSFFGRDVFHGTNGWRTVSQSSRLTRSRLKTVQIPLGLGVLATLAPEIHLLYGWLAFNTVLAVWYLLGHVPPGNPDSRLDRYHA